MPLSPAKARQLAETLLRANVLVTPLTINIAASYLINGVAEDERKDNVVRFQHLKPYVIARTK